MIERLLSSPTLTLGAVFGLIYLVLFLNRPDLGFALLLIVRGFSDAVGARGDAPGSGMMASLMNPNMALILTLLAAGGLFMLSRRAPFLSLPAGSLLVLFFVVGLLSTAIAESKTVALYAWVRAASVIVVYALAAYLFRTPQRIQRAIDILAVAFVVPALLAFYQLRTGGGFYDAPIGVYRVTSTFSHPGPFGEFLILFISVFVCQALVQTGARKLVALVIVAAAGLLVVETYTRSSWAGALIVVFVVGALSKRPTWVIVPLAAVLVGSMIPSISHRVADVGTGTGSLADREAIWQNTLPQWLDATENRDSSVSTFLNRLVGTGPGSTESLSLRGHGFAFAAHNDYLAILIQYGILGLLLFLATLVALLTMAYRAWRHAPDRVMAAIPLSFFAVTLAFLVMRTTANIFGATANEVYLWTLAGLTVAVRQMAVAQAPIRPRADRQPLPQLAGQPGAAVAVDNAGWGRAIHTPVLRRSRPVHGDGRP